MVKQSLSTVSSMTNTASPECAPVEFIECDYERNCTPLYRAIETAVIQEDEDFEEVAHFVETGQWMSKNMPSGPSASIQAKTWVTRFQTKKGKKVVEWSQLPLHLAIVGGAPSNVIGGLVKLYPQALRCTDDQQMLPLHLALRHGADDEIVAYLLMQFPEAVNAMGKNDRTPVDCALRARDKLRGIILETFVEKNKAKLIASHNKIADALTAEKQSLEKALDNTSAQLDATEKELNALKDMRKQYNILLSDFDSLKTMKTSMEDSLMVRLNDLSNEKSQQENNLTQKIQRLESEKLTESIEYQKKIDILKAEKSSAEKAEARAMAENEALRKELGAVHKNVSKSQDWEKLKKELDAMHGEQLARSRSNALENIDDLKSELHGNLEKSVEDKIKSELKGILKTVQKLERTGSKVKNPEQLDALRSEVETLRKELRETAAASSLKVELTNLRKNLEDEMKTPEEKTDQQMKSLENAMKETKPKTLESKTVAELKGLKSQIESLQLELTERKLLHKTTKDVHDLEVSLQQILEVADSATKKELSSMKKAIESLKTFVSTPKSREDMVSASKDVKTMKELLHVKDISLKIQSGLSEIQEVIANESKGATGKARRELSSMHKRIHSLLEKAAATKNIDELEAIQTETLDMKKDIHHVQEAIQTQRELNELKKTLEKEITDAAKQSKKELAEMKKAVDAINLEQKESKDIKSTLTKEIQKATSKTEKDLLALKKTVDKMDISSLESKNKSEWDSIRSEMDSLKSNLTNVKQDDGQLVEIKAAIADLSTEQESKTGAKLAARAPTTTTSTEEPAVNPKKKNKLTKFFSKKKGSLQPAPVEVKEEPEDASSTPTFLPPSMSKDEIDLHDDSSDNGNGPPAVQKVNSMKQKEGMEVVENSELEVTLELHRTMSKVDAEAVRALPSFDSVSQKETGIFIPSAMRKVKSMDPRMKNVTIDPAEVVRSWSKSILGVPSAETERASNKTELESVEESRSEAAAERE